MKEAWANQAASLVEVQRYGSQLEREVRNLLDWDSGRVFYDQQRGHKIQVDCVYPDLACPEAIVSVTYSDPTTPGHSNENKLQLKLGELALLKWAYPNIRVVLALGGTEEAWLKYVLVAFRFFFDDVIFLWDEEEAERLLGYSENPHSIPLKHSNFWAGLLTDWNTRNLSSSERIPPCGLVRYAVLDKLKGMPISHRPEDIPFDIGRACMSAARDAGGKEWQNCLRGNWKAIEMSRSYFNPVEAATQLTLDYLQLDYQGGLAVDVEVRNFLHDLGMSKTKLSEDFILFSERYNCPVYIQCKASGGGRKQHGKNIQNRTKEQVARSILYTASAEDGETLDYNKKDFVWIGVVDGDWGVTKREPLKYVNMLELAGYDHIVCATELIDEDLNLKTKRNSLVAVLNDLQCRCRQ